MLLFEKIKPSEITILQSLAHQIWNDSYQQMISQEQIEYMLNMIFNTQKLQTELNSNYHWYFILLQSERIGFLCFFPKENEMFLSKLYLQKQHQGKGLATQALLFVENNAKAHNLPSISLTVNKGNNKAIKSYEKFGFSIESSKIFDIGNGFVMDDYIMQKKC